MLNEYQKGTRGGYLPIAPIKTNSSMQVVNLTGDTIFHKTPLNIDQDMGG